MRLDFAVERMLAVVAHPDDMELLCGGTLARARDDGATVGVCVLCQGDKGGAGDAVALAQRRRAECTAAAELLAASTFFGNVPDAALADCAEHRRTLIEVLRHFRPTTVLAHSRTDYHADHRAAGTLTECASWFACSTGHRTGQEPLARPPALWWMDTVTMLDFDPGFYVDVTNYMELKEQMLACHRSQLDHEEHEDCAPLTRLMRHQTLTRGAQAGVAAAEAFQIHRAWKRLSAW